MKVLIVDDEPLAIASMRRMVEPLGDVSVVGSARSARAAMHLCETQRPDLVLLDIEMPQMDGVTFARDLPAAHAPLVVFITAYDQFAVDAFDIEAVDYVLKPVDPVRLEAAIDKARTRLAVRPLMQAVETAAQRLVASEKPAPARAEQPVYWAKVDGSSVRIVISDIRHVEACRDYVYIHTRTSKLMVRETMAALEGVFAGSSLQRIHRSHFVNIDHIRSVVRDTGHRQVTLDSGEDIPVGRRFYGRLLEAIDTGATAMT